MPLPLGICILLLALFPTDARAIRVVCATLLVVLTGLGALFIGAGDLSMKIGEGAFGLPLAALLFAAAAALIPTLRCRGYRAMQPRPALRWLRGQCTVLNHGCVTKLRKAFR